MIAVIRDPGLLRSVRPESIHLYLESRGWRPHLKVSEFGSVWHSVQNRSIELLVPDTAAIGDYANRLGDLLADLERVENRSQLNILSDILNIIYDVIRVRSSNEDTADGTIRIDEGAHLVSAARDMMLNAASSAISPKPLFPTNRSGQAQDFIKDSTRLGQSESGSYVITVITRLKQGPETPMFPGISDPFERKVTLTLADALSTIAEGAERALADGQIESLKSAHQKGVSANLCDSIVEMSGPRKRSIDFNFAWSPAFRIPPGTADSVAIRSDYIPIIEEVGKQLRATSPIDSFQLVGVVTDLHRGEKEISGRVTVFGFVEGRAKKVSVELAPSEYDKAIAAHDDRAPVRCVGTLVKVGRSFVLRNPGSLEVLTRDQDVSDDFPLTR